MSLLNKIKSVTNSITGGSAKVALEITSLPSRTQPFSVRVSAMVANQNLQIKRVYVRLKGEESIIARHVDRRYGYSDVNQSEILYEQDFDIAGEQTLLAGHSYTWEGQVDASDMETRATYLGRNARHEWSVLAGLDAPGNDPDSDWVDIQMD